MKIAVLFSGGKDSTFALFKAMQEHEIACLISIISDNPESYMFHTPNIHIVEMQAEAIDLPLIKAKTKGIKEDELRDLKRAIEKAKKKYKIEGIVTGAVASRYQAERIQKICDDLSLKCINPLWGISQTQLLNEIVDSKFKVIITQIAAEGFNEAWLGREINKKTVKELEELNKKYGLSIAFEGGEAETLVVNAPFFKREIKIIKAKKLMDSGCSGYLKIEKAELIRKQ